MGKGKQCYVSSLDNHRLPRCRALSNVGHKPSQTRVAFAARVVIALVEVAAVVCAAAWVSVLAEVAVMVLSVLGTVVVGASLKSGVVTK